MMDSSDARQRQAEISWEGLHLICRTEAQKKLGQRTHLVKPGATSYPSRCCVVQIFSCRNPSTSMSNQLAQAKVLLHLAVDFFLNVVNSDDDHLARSVDVYKHKLWYLLKLRQTLSL